MAAAEFGDKGIKKDAHDRLLHVLNNAEQCYTPEGFDQDADDAFVCESMRETCAASNPDDTEYSFDFEYFRVNSDGHAVRCFTNESAPKSWGNLTSWESNPPRVRVHQCPFLYCPTVGFEYIVGEMWGSLVAVVVSFVLSLAILSRAQFHWQRLPLYVGLLADRCDAFFSPPYTGARRVVVTSSGQRRVIRSRPRRIGAMRAWKESMDDDRGGAHTAGVRHAGAYAPDGADGYEQDADGIAATCKSALGRCAYVTRGCCWSRDDVEESFSIGEHHTRFDERIGRVELKSDACREGLFCCCCLGMCCGSRRLRYGHLAPVMLWVLRALVLLPAALVTWLCFRLYAYLWCSGQFKHRRQPFFASLIFGLVCLMIYSTAFAFFRWREDEWRLSRMSVLAMIASFVSFVGIFVPLYTLEYLVRDTRVRRVLGVRRAWAMFVVLGEGQHRHLTRAPPVPPQCQCHLTPTLHVAAAAAATPRPALHLSQRHRSRAPHRRAESACATASASSASTPSFSP